MIRHVNDLGAQGYREKEQEVQKNSDMGTMPGMFHGQKSSVSGETQTRGSLEKWR